MSTDTVTPLRQRWRISSANHGGGVGKANAAHVSVDQMKVMTAIGRCRTVAVGVAGVP